MADYDLGYELLGNYLSRKYATKIVELPIILENRLYFHRIFEEARESSRRVRKFLEYRSENGVWDESILDDATIYSNGFDLSVSGAALEAIKLEY